MKISAKDHVFEMSAKKTPVIEVESGSVVTFETLDCFSNAIRKSDHLFGSIDWNEINPATGPLAVKGAEKGDLLKVEILDIRLDSQGAMVTVPEFGVLGREMERETTKIVPIEGNEAVFSDRLRLPLAPMIGVIGVAPEGEPVVTGTPGDHGGNMDCTRIGKGATLYFRVGAPGALLALGDLHALMGDGEIVVCGVEISGEVDVRVTVLKDVVLPAPFLASGDEVMALASAPTLDQAAEAATKKMHRFLTERCGMEVHEAGMLLSAVGNLRVCQVVDPEKTARMEIPLWVAEKLGFRLD